MARVRPRKTAMMWSKGSTAEAATRADALHQAEVRSWWRDWHRYLQAHLQLLDAQAAEATHAPSFERTADAWEQQHAEAEQTLKRIPHDRRVVFDRTRDGRRAEMQAHLEVRATANGATGGGGRDPHIVDAGALAIGVWWVWPRGRAQAAVPPSTDLRVNGQPAAVWPVVRLTVMDARGTRITLPVTATDA